MRRFLAIMGLLLGVFVVACQVIAGIDRVDKSDLPDTAPPPEAAPPPPPPPIPDPCQHVLPPDSPDADPKPNVEDQLDPFFVAFRNVHLIAGGDGGTGGFDLDGVCTCDNRPGSAHDGGASCNNGGPPLCDFDGGVDNGQATVFQKFGSFLPNNETLDQAAGVNEHIEEGLQGMLIYISDYNGLEDDQNVSVGFILSHGILDPSGCGTDASAPPYAPGWCGNDQWTVDPDGVLGRVGAYAPTLVGKGYVNHWQLVVTDDRGYFEVPFGSLSVRFYSPLVSATIVPLDSAGNPRDPTTPPSGPTDRNYRLENGVLAGRVPLSTMLKVAGALVNPSGPDSGTYLCQSEVFGVLKEAICMSGDIASNKTGDFNPAALCDAVSTATSFTAQPALAGVAYRPADFLNVCVQADADGGDGGDASDDGGLAALYTCP